jgi:hypothetical protein
MRPIELDLDLDTADLDGLSSAVDSSITAIALDGALISGGTYSSVDGLGHILVLIDQSTDTQSDVTFTVTGTDPNDNAISEVITGPGSTLTVASTKYFKTVSSIVASAAQGGTETLDVGTRGTTLAAASKAIPLDWRSNQTAMVDVDVTGTLNFTVQETFDNLLTNTNASGNIVWHDVTALASKTADTTAALSLGARGMRVIINTYSTGAELQAMIIQPGND